MNLEGILLLPRNTVVGVVDPLQGDGLQSDVVEDGVVLLLEILSGHLCL